MQPIHIEPSKLRTSPSNPRAIRDNAMEKLMLSIAEDPELMEARPLIVNDRMEVLAGNQRLRACIALEWPTVPCVVVDWDEAKQRRAMIKDNVSAGEWDQDMLANEWEVEELKEMGLNLDWDEPEEREGLTDPDDVPEVPEEPTTKLGDVWLLGEHRVMCGDSTKAEDVERLMDGATAEALVTDPPYGIGISSNPVRQKHEKKNWDASAVEPKQFLDMVEQAIIWGGNYFDLPPAKGFFVWDKKQPENFTLAMCEQAWTNIDTPAKIYRLSVTSYAKEHPTQKPVDLMEWCIEKTQGTIFDPFLGSGSTLIAAEKTGRKCYGMELDPKYCDVIVKRWEAFTGKKATLWKQ